MSGGRGNPIHRGSTQRSRIDSRGSEKRRRHSQPRAHARPGAPSRVGCGTSVINASTARPTVLGSVAESAWCQSGANSAFGRERPQALAPAARTRARSLNIGNVIPSTPRRTPATRAPAATRKPRRDQGEQTEPDLIGITRTSRLRSEWTVTADRPGSTDQTIASSRAPCSQIDLRSRPSRRNPQRSASRCDGSFSGCVRSSSRPMPARRNSHLTEQQDAARHQSPPASRSTCQVRHLVVVTRPPRGDHGTERRRRRLPR